MRVLILAMLCWPVVTTAAAEAQTMNGYYRFGHEVNTVCTSGDETCYWLVDTADDLRRQLKQAVADLAPYTPACLRMVAEISDAKADGFGADYDGSIRVLEILEPCDGEATRTTTQLADLQHRRWLLETVNGLPLADYARELGFDEDSSRSKVPELDFGEQGYVAGNTACNQFQGQAQVVDNELILSRLATTLMLCQGFAAELETQLQLLYRNPLRIVRSGNGMTLSALDTELGFRLRDWVQ